MLPRVVETHGPADALGLVGSTIDQVRIDACVDAGGFGLIYRGFHEGLGEAVAIKCLRIQSIQKTNEKMREALAGRFRDETKLLYRLSQGNLDIVRCISSGTLVAPKTKEYTPYMVLEWLDGCTLSAEIKERRERKLGRRSLEAAVELLESAAGGLAYAHSHDVVHRDVKPGNLFLARTREGVRMKVLDFGLAKILSDEAIGVRASVETGVGVYFCSPSYGAPEQYSPQVGKIGPWTDVYSLCLVLFEVMLGEKVRPAGSLADGLLKALDPETGSPSASDLGLLVPRSVEKLLKRALSQNPLARPNDAGVFWSSLKEAMRETPDMAATVSNDALDGAINDLRDTAVLRAAPPSPFAGTMLMEPGPSGSPQLVAPLPAAGRPPTPASARAASTSPLSPPLRVGEDALKMTMPIGATSPLATSLAIPSPLRPESGPPPPNYPAPGAAAAYGHQQQQYDQKQQQQQQRRASLAHPGAPQRPEPRADIRTDPRARVSTDPPMGIGSSPPTKKRNTGLVAIVALVVLGVIGGTFLWLRLHGH